MPSVALWFQSTESWPAVLLAVAASSLLGLTALFVVQLRRQVQAAWTETGRIYQRSSARFAAVGNLVDGILFETDLSRTLTFTNQAFHSLTGFRERDLRSGLTLVDLFDPEERLRLQEDLEAADDLQAVRVRNCHLQCRDGAVVPVRLRMAAIVEQKRLVGWRGLLESRPDPEESREPRDAEKILGGILRDFNDTPPAEHEVALERALAEIGRILGADRCYHYHSSGDGESLLSLRQWYAPGVSPMTGDQRIPGLDHFPWSLACLRDDGALAVSDVQYLDNDEAPERNRWLRQGITSLLLVPLREGREIVGLLGCETLGRVRHWGQRDRQLLEALAEICQRYQDVGQAARRLEQANERAGDLAELLPEPVAVTDADGEIVVWNPALAELSDLAPDAVRGRGAAAVLNEFLPGGGDWLRGQPTADAGQLFEIPGRGEDSVWIRISRRPLADGVGSLLHFCDVTAAKAEESRMRARSDRLERAVARQQEKLEQAQIKLVENEKMAAVARMVTGLAHEINLPVGVGLTSASHLAECADRLERSYGDGLMRRSDFEDFLTVSRQSCGLIRDNLQRAADLVSGMKRAAAGAAVEHRRQISLQEYLEGVLLNLEPHLSQKHIASRCRCPDDLILVAEPDAIYSIVSNLVLNSVQHAFEGMLMGEIDIEVEKLDSQLRIRFTDNGRGIEQEQQDRIFEPFYTTARDAGGTGLGLHIVYNLVTRNLGGTLRCRSRVGKGTVFEILIPHVEDIDHVDRPE